MNLSSVEQTLLEPLLPAALLQELLQEQPPTSLITAACERLEAALTALLPFVPAPVVDVRLASPGLSPILGQRLNGTLVCADLSGFTALSSQLATAGRQGSEEISAIINQLFAALLDQIYAHGGGLINFGGDALNAWFDERHLGSDHAALGCAAALAMQARMADFAAIPTSKGPFRLRLRIVAHSGPIFVAEAGDHSHTELVVTGRTINDAIVALDATGPAETVVSATSLEQLGDPIVTPKVSRLYLLHQLRPTPARPPALRLPWPHLPPSLDTLHTLAQRIAAIQPYVPHSLPQRFVGELGISGEFRPVSVLFADFYPLARLQALLDRIVSEQATIIGQVIHTYYARTQAIVHTYGGSINKVDMAASGNRLMALFGAPIAHEDDPTRATQAALGLRSALDDINDEIARLLRVWMESQPHYWTLLRTISSPLQQRIGIASGTVFAGIVGTAQRHEYTVMGETVNLAARLLSAAEQDTLLLTSRTYRMAQALLEAQPLPPQPLKGFASPVPIFRAIRERDAAERLDRPLHHEAPLIGRQQEHTQLLALGRIALRPGMDAGRVAALVGEAGVGKSRLGEELLRDLADWQPAPFMIRDACRSYEQTSPYALAARLTRQLLDLAAHGDRETQATATRRRLDELVPHWSRFAPLLGELLSLPIAPTALIQALTPEQRRDRLHDMVIALCIALARRRPLLLVVDDLHWADASSHTLLARLARELPGQPILLLLIYRSASDLAEPWREMAHCLTITLNELARADSERLLRVLLDGDLPAELQPLIERTHGTPFFLEETVRYLLESGTLERDALGRWIPTRQIDAGSVPVRVEQLVIARLDRLREETRSLAQIAAVIGQQFPKQLLAVVSAQNGALADRLGELIDASLLQPDEHAAQLSYRFRQAVIHSVAYDSMLFARRRELHARVARAIEQEYAGRLDEQRVVLAQHYARAELHARALPHFIQAAQQAQARYANDEAIALYSQALASGPERADQPDDLECAALIYENLGDVLALIGDYQHARERHEQLLRRLSQRQDPATRIHQAALQRKIGSTYEHQGHHEQALLWLEQAQATLVAHSQPEAALEQARIMSEIGWVSFRQGALDRAQQQLEQALAGLGPHADYAEQARILNRLGGVAWTRGDLAAAQHYVEQNLQVSSARDDIIGQANALNNLGIITERQGKLQSAVQYGLQAMELNERIGNRRGVAFAANNVGMGLYHQEEHRQARAYFSRAIAYASELRDSYTEMRALLNLARTLAALGEWINAEQIVSRSLALADKLQLLPEQLDAYVLLAEIALDKGDTAAAAQRHGQAQALANDTESEEYGRFQRIEARLALLQGERERATQLLDANEQLFTNLQNTPEANRTRRLRAALRL